VGGGLSAYTCSAPALQPPWHVQGIMYPTDCPTVQKSSKKCFDSADWALAKEGRQSEEALQQPIETLPIKLQPTTPMVPRRHSNLGDC
jgi:hypothetical protein